MKINVSTDDPAVCRAMHASGMFRSEELFRTESNGHRFKVGETRTLHGLESYPEYNGETVEITAIREDGPRGKAYYVKGRITEMVNWVYEYRLK